MHKLKNHVFITLIRDVHNIISFKLVCVATPHPMLIHSLLKRLTYVTSTYRNNRKFLESSPTLHFFRLAFFREVSEHFVVNSYKTIRLRWLILMVTSRFANRTSANLIPYTAGKFVVVAYFANTSTCGDTTETRTPVPGMKTPCPNL